MSTVAVEVDSVLAKYDKWQGLDHIGDPIDGAVEFTKALSKFCSVLIYTTRCSTVVNSAYDEQTLVAKVKAWLDKHGFEYKAIWSGKGKPIAVAYVDDRGISCRPQEDIAAFDVAVELARVLAK